jgi:hypothetical protein
MFERLQLRSFSKSSSSINFYTNDFVKGWMILNDGELGVLGSNYKYLGNFLFG